MLVISLSMNHSKSIHEKYKNYDEIYNLALKYLEKYHPSKKSLQVYLFRKVLDNQDTSLEKSKVMEMVNQCLEKLEENGILNDQLYSEIKSKNLLKRGYSVNKIRLHLLKKGINQDNLKNTIQKIYNDQVNPDLYSAIRICKKKRIGPYRPDANKELYYKKDMAVLARSGFNYEISKDVLSLDKKELSIYEKKL